MIRPAFFIWVPVLAALWLVVKVIGWPYLNWSYDFRSARGTDPFAERYYTRCTYWNPADTRTVFPKDGKCPRIRFFLNDDGGR